jgi:hypothetical protein
LSDGLVARTQPHRRDDRGRWGTHGRRGQQKPTGGTRHRTPHTTRDGERSVGSGHTRPAAGPRRHSPQRGQTAIRTG